MSRYIFKGAVIFLIAISVGIFAPATVLAADLRSGDTVDVGRGQVIDDDLYVAGGTIIVDGTVNGDLWAVGKTITVNGTVNGSIVAIGETVAVNGDVARAARLAGATVEVSGSVGSDLIVFGGDARIASTAKIDGDFILGVGNVCVDGLVAGDIKGRAGEVTITSTIGGDVELDVESLTIAPAASIQGNLTYTSETEADIRSGARVGGKTTHNVPEVKKTAKTAFAAGIAGMVTSKVLGFLMILVAGMIIILIAPGRSAAVADSIRGRPWLSLGWGAVILFATPVAAIMVCITVIGIPVGLIALALWGIAIYLSQIFVGLFIGRWIIGYFRQVETKAMLIGALAAGLAILSLLRLIPFLSFFIWLAIALFGIGAVVVSEAKLRAGAQQVSSE